MAPTAPTITALKLHALCATAPLTVNGSVGVARMTLLLTEVTMLLVAVVGSGGAMYEVVGAKVRLNGGAEVDVVAAGTDEVVGTRESDTVV